MADLHWVQIAVSLVAGGMAGQVIRIAYERWSGRVQPVVYETSFDSVFASAPHAGVLQAQAQVSYDGQEYQFESLSLLRIRIKNTSNRDHDAFTFGITLDEADSAVLCSPSGADRHHKIVEASDKANPAAPKRQLDFTCTPFNRKDQYDVRVYLSGTSEGNEPAVSTAAAVRLVQKEIIEPAVRTKELMLAMSLSVAFIMLGVIALFTTYTVWEGMSLVQKTNRVATEADAINAEILEQLERVIDQGKRISELEQQVREKAQQGKKTIESFQSQRGDGQPSASPSNPSESPDSPE
ncbi:MAG: hypothetical protein DWQ37_23670 [Planctomycetota bacterium]|mgnify:CR=1 FL=1|nr:MAG: hypothetical protein DWQ37_23670 [Planctomycetota bacterium]